MNNLEVIELENGLKVFLINDNTKHTTYINLVVKYGGINNEFYVNEKKYKMRDGMAHLIEHIVLESNIYGDIMKMFGELGIRSNGMTYIDRTRYYIDTVEHIYDGLKVLIKGIHSPVINDEILNNIKKPILEEKRRSLDNKNRVLYNNCISSVKNNKNFKTILGEINDIESITIRDIKTCFNAFYRPENEIIVIGGRFDKEKILEVINNTYNGIEFSKDNIKKIVFNHKNTVNKKKISIKENTAIGKTSINFKINTLSLNPAEKLEFDIYIACFLRMNFGIISSLYKELVENNLVSGGIGYSNSLLESYQLVRIETDTKFSNRFVKRVLNFIYNKEYILDKELFELYKRNFIIDLILRNDNIYDMVDPLIENIICFNYEKLDSVCDLEKLNYNEFVRCIESIDFSNYSVCELKTL